MLRSIELRLNLNDAVSALGFRELGQQKVFRRMVPQCDSAFGYFKAHWEKILGVQVRELKFDPVICPSKR